MSGHGKVFDENISGLPDLTIEVDPEKMMDKTIVNEDDIILEDEEVNERYMKPSEIFVMRQKKKQQERFDEENLERKMKNVKINEENKIIEKKNNENIGISKEEPQTNIDLEIKEEEPVKKTRGKRGKDKKIRKKREMTAERKQQLADARKKSLEVRRAKAEAKKANKITRKEEQIKTEPIPIPPPRVAQIKSQMSFDYFCDLMDKYEERKRKKVSVSHEPHPNKKIPYHQKPRPPIQKVQRAKASIPQSTRRNGNVKRENVKITPQLESFSAYSILKNQNKNIHSSTWGY